MIFCKDAYAPKQHYEIVMFLFQFPKTFHYVLISCLWLQWTKVKCWLVFRVFFRSGKRQNRQSKILQQIKLGLSITAVEIVSGCLFGFEENFETLRRLCGLILYHLSLRRLEIVSQQTSSSFSELILHPNFMYFCTENNISSCSSDQAVLLLYFQENYVYTRLMLLWSRYHVSVYGTSSSYQLIHNSFSFITVVSHVLV